MLLRYLFFLVISYITFISAYAEINFSIRYHDKNIYYPDDTIKLQITLNNTGTMEHRDESFYLADDLRQSFGFDLRSLTGIPAPQAEGYNSSLRQSVSYRLVNLAPGQQLSMIVPLNDWVQIDDANQYRLTGFFYPKLRGAKLPVQQSQTVLDLTILPKSQRQWNDKLDEDIKSALLSRDLDPWKVVKETFEQYALSRYNRALIYLDMKSLINFTPQKMDADSLERILLRGLWDAIPGFENPTTSINLISSQIFNEESIVSIEANYNPLGEYLKKRLRIYLHKKEGFWAIRRIENLGMNDSASGISNYGSPLTPPEVVSAMIDAAIRGDWDIVLRFYDIEDMVRNLPEYSGVWKNMSSTEHNLALADYRKNLIAGKMNQDRIPLADMETWKIISVNYTDSTGSVVVSNNKIYSTVQGDLDQQTMYTFRLKRTQGPNSRWIIDRYDTLRIK